MNTHHTPGPWKQRKGFSFNQVEIFHPDKRVKKPCVPTELATVEINDDSKATIAESRANARLIAAAPDLLTALRICQVRLFILDGSQNPEYQAASAAITKATQP